MTPIFRIFDYALAREFYIAWLGFQIDWEDQPGNPEGYLQVSRADVVLHLELHKAGPHTGARARAEIRGLLSFHHWLHEKTSSFTAPPLLRAPWNERVLEMEITDPFGNQIIFCEPYG